MQAYPLGNAVAQKFNFKTMLYIMAGT